MIILFDYSIKILCNQNYRNVYKYQRPLPVLNSLKNKVRLDTNIQVAITIIKSYKNIHTAYYMYLLLIFCDTCSNYQPPNYFPIISYLFIRKGIKILCIIEHSYLPFISQNRSITTGFCDESVLMRISFDLHKIKSFNESRSCEDQMRSS